MTQTVNANDPIKDRLLEEAERLFAMQGYHGVSVREITQAAGAHLSAVNYHFGSKWNLYLEVFRQRWIPRALVVTAPIREMAQNGCGSLEEVIRTTASAFLRGFKDDDQAMIHHQLFARELAHQSEALGEIVAAVNQPNVAALAKLLKPYLRPDTSPEKVLLFISSIVAQILHFNFGRPLLAHIYGQRMDDALVDRIIDHITEFSLKGLPGAVEGAA